MSEGGGDTRRHLRPNTIWNFLKLEIVTGAGPPGAARGGSCRRAVSWASLALAQGRSSTHGQLSPGRREYGPTQSSHMHGLHKRQNYARLQGTVQVQLSVVPLLRRVVLPICSSTDTHTGLHGPAQRKIPEHGTPLHPISRDTYPARSASSWPGWCSGG